MVIVASDTTPVPLPMQSFTSIIAAKPRPQLVYKVSSAFPQFLYGDLLDPEYQLT